MFGLAEFSCVAWYAQLNYCWILLGMSIRALL
jgi:hypothetical protein